MLFVIQTLSPGNNGESSVVLTYKHEISLTLSWNPYKPSIGRLHYGTWIVIHLQSYTHVAILYTTASVGTAVLVKVIQGNNIVRRWLYDLVSYLSYLQLIVA